MSTSESLVEPPPIKETPAPRHGLAALRKRVAEWATLGVLFALLLIGAVGHPDIFFTQANLANILNGASFTIMIALGLTVVLIVGEYDLSVAGIATLAGCAAVGTLTRLGLPWPLTIVVGLGVAALAGAWNAMLVSRLRISSFISTLGTSTIVVALAYVFADGRIQSVPSGASFTEAGRAAPFWGIGVPVFVTLAVAILLASGYRRTVIGRHFYAIGGNRAAAKLAGVRVDALVRLAFVIGAILTGLGGILYSMYQGYADINLAGGYLLPAFAAAFIGAATLRIGRFHIWGTVVGGLLLQVVTVLVVLYDLPQDLSLAFQGLVLVFAVALGSLLGPRRDRT